MSNDPERTLDRSTEQRAWDTVRAYGEARFRAILQAQGLDSDRMSEDEKMEYIDRVIHEHRAEQRARRGIAANV